MESFFKELDKAYDVVSNSLHLKSDKKPEPMSSYSIGNLSRIEFMQEICKGTITHEELVKVEPSIYVELTGYQYPKYKIPTIESLLLLRKNRLTALNMLTDFIDGGTWYRGHYKDEFLRSYRLPVKQFALRTGHTEVSVRKLFSRASARLREMLGYDYISKIVYGDADTLKEAYSILFFANRDISQLFLRDVVGQVTRSPITEEYDLDELGDELAFLRLFNSTVVSNALKSLDLDKLCFILNTLEGSEPEQFKLKSSIIKEISLSRKAQLSLDAIGCVGLGSVNDCCDKLDTLVKSYRNSSKS